MPFAVMVPEGDPDMRLRALDHGVDDVIVKSSSLEEIVARIKNILVREAARAYQLRGERAVGVSGHLRSFPVEEITQMLSMGQKTAGVTLTAPHRSGSFWFRDGRLIHAETGNDTGMAAFDALLGWDDAEFLIQHGRTPESESMNTDPTALLLKHCGWLDEIAASVEDGLVLDRPPAGADEPR